MKNGGIMKNSKKARTCTKAHAHTKAYAYTIYVMLMSVAIISLASYSSQNLRQSRTDYVSLESAESLSYAADDIEEDISSIIGTRIFAFRNSTHLSILINDTSQFPQSPSYLLQMGQYGDYLQGSYYEKTNSIVNISSSIFEQNGTVYVFSNPSGTYAHSSNTDATSNKTHDVANLTISRAQGASLSAVRLSVYYCNSTRTGFSQMPYDPAGTINVSIEYTDLTGTLRQNTTISSGTYRSFAVDYTLLNETFEFLIDTSDEDSIVSSLLLSQQFSCTWGVNYTLQQDSSSGEFVATYPNLQANYSQGLGNYTKKALNFTAGKT